MMRPHGFLAITMLLSAFAVSQAASGGTTEPSADLSPEAWLSPLAQIPFQEYREVPHMFRYKAFAVEPESGQWGQSTEVRPPEVAINLALEDCQRRSANDCHVYAIGDIIVLGLVDWKIEVAIRLYQVKPDATNDDLDAVMSSDGSAEVMALRRSVLLTAAEMGSSEAISAMLDRGVNIDASSNVGATALSYAASRGHPEAVALLLERGADVNARNGVDKTALSLAMLATNFARPRDYLAADHDAVVRLLVDAGGIE